MYTSQQTKFWVVRLHTRLWAGRGGGGGKCSKRNIFFNCLYNWKSVKIDLFYWKGTWLSFGTNIDNYTSIYQNIVKRKEGDIWAKDPSKKKCQLAKNKKKAKTTLYKLFSFQCKLYRVWLRPNKIEFILLKLINKKRSTYLQSSVPKKYFI